MLMEKGKWQVGLIRYAERGEVLIRPFEAYPGI